MGKMFLFNVLIVCVLYASAQNSDSNKVTFRVKSFPTVEAIFTTKYYWGIETSSSGKRSLTYSEFSTPLVLKLFSDGTLILFYTHLKGEALDKKYNYQTKDDFVYRGNWKVTGTRLDFDVVRKHVTIEGGFQYLHNQLDSNLVGRKYPYITLKGEIVMKNAGLKPWMFEESSNDKRIELFKIDDFYYIEKLSEKLQDSLQISLEKRILQPLR